MNLPRRVRAFSGPHDDSGVIALLVYITNGEFPYVVLYEDNNVSTIKRIEEL